MNFQAFVSSRQGRRKENQDNFLIILPENGQGVGRYLNNQMPFRCDIQKWPENVARIAVADGMGGHKGGREMSQAVVEGLTKIPPCKSPDQLKEYVIQLHRHLLKRFYTGDSKSPGSTLVLAEVQTDTGDTMLLNIGDSRAFLLRKDSYRQLTCDHNVAEFSMRDGKISQSEYKKRLQSGDRRLVQAVGFGSMGIFIDEKTRKAVFSKDIRIDLKDDLPEFASENADIIQKKLSPDEILLLASDGLWVGEKDGKWKGLPNEELLCREGPFKLVDNAWKRGSRDNITVVLCGFIEKEG